MVLVLRDDSIPSSLDGSVIRFLGGRPLLADRGVGCTLGSRDSSSVSIVLVVRALRGDFLRGVPALLFVPALGSGVPLDLRGRPRRLGVAVSSSITSLSGTVVVVALSLLRLGGSKGLED